MAGGLILHAVGDLGFCGRIAERIRRGAGASPLDGIAPTLGSADVVFGNLEILMSGGQTASDESPAFEAPPEAADLLARAGFHVLSLANNHAMDFGLPGLVETRRRLETAGIRTVGAGNDLEDARRPVVVERAGTRVGFLAYAVPFPGSARANAPGPAPLDLAIVRDDVHRLRGKADVVVVSAHFGMMYLEHPTPEDMTLARAIVDAGADVVLGHHPHVLQGIERHGRGVIAYSLGELLFDAEAGYIHATVARERRRHGIIFRAELTPGDVSVLDPFFTRLGEDLCPVVLEGAAAEADRAHLDEISRALHDEVFRARFWDYAGNRLLAYQIDGVRSAVRDGRILHLLGRLHRIRLRHVRLLLGWLRAQLGRSAGVST